MQYGSEDAPYLTQTILTGFIFSCIITENIEELQNEMCQLHILTYTGFYIQNERKI